MYLLRAASKVLSSSSYLVMGRHLRAECSLNKDCRGKENL